MPDIIAIDPGPTKSAWVRYDADLRKPIAFGKHDNAVLIREWRLMLPKSANIAIEMVASYGKPVGKEVFETCVWIGRFVEASGDPDAVTLIERKDVKLHLCHSISKVTDAVIRQRLIDLFGPGKDAAIGKKAAPGPLYGITADCWQALALAVTFADKMQAARDN